MACKETKAMTVWEFEMIRAMEGYDWMLANDMVNKEDQKETGYIGCMTMYYQKQDDRFTESWHSSFGLTEPPGFLAELRAVIHYLRESTRYRILWEPGKPAWSQADYKCRFKDRCHPDFSARVDTGQYTYLFRCDEAFRDRDVRIFCYDKETVKTFLKQWEEKHMMREKEVTMKQQKEEENFLQKVFHIQNSHEVRESYDIVVNSKGTFVAVIQRGRFRNFDFRLVQDHNGSKYEGEWTYPPCNLDEWLENHQFSVLHVQDFCGRNTEFYAKSWVDMLEEIGFHKHESMISRKAEKNDDSQKEPAKIQPTAIGRKREGSISWDEYFMGVASLSAMRSKDPNTQVGCCIVGAKNRIASVGYNGFPFGCDDDEYPWSRRMEGLEESKTKYPYVVHSELNAILNYRGESLEGAKMYVTMFPCCECAKAIIQSGIREVVYRDEVYLHSQSGIAATRMFKSAGVTVRQLSCREKIDIQI